MKSLGKILTAIQEIANDFNGEITLKNDKRQYFFVDENWVKKTGIEKKDVIGKIDSEIFPPDTAMQIMGNDAEVVAKKLLIKYTKRIVFKGQPISSLVIKWVVPYDTGGLFCICTLSDRPENKNDIHVVRKKIEALFEKVV